MAARALLKSKTPVINFRFIPMKHNEHEIPLLEDFARSLSVDMLTLKSLNPHDHGEVDANIATGLSYMPQDPRYRRFAYDEHGARIRLANNPCKRPWMNPSIHWDGKVSLCTFDAQDHFVMGDLMKENFKKIWWGEAYSSFVNSSVKTTAPYPFATGVRMPLREGSAGSDVIRERYVFNSDIFKTDCKGIKRPEERGGNWLDLDWWVVGMLRRIVICQR